LILQISWTSAFVVSFSFWNIASQSFSENEVQTVSHCGPTPMKPGQLNGVFIIAAVNLGIAMKNDKAKATQIRVKLFTRFMHSNEPVIERRKIEKITFNDF
jgi:hypothetical protein